MAFSTQRHRGTEITENYYNNLSYKIIECCIEVHKELGPGLMESVYEVCVEKELLKAGINVKRQVVLPVIYKEEILNEDYVIDMLIDDLIIIEFKSVETVLPVHEAQLVTYLKLSGKKLGLLINFNVAILKDGIRRRINGNLNSE